MFATIRNAWKIADLRKKMIFTFFVLLIFRLGAAIPVPYVNVDALTNYFNAELSGTILGLYNAMSGSAFSQATTFALGIQPYINASIIIQLLCIAIPYLEQLQKDGGEEGKKKLERITRYTTLGISLLMGWAYYMMLRNYNGILTDTGFLYALVIILTFTGGSCLVMWLGEQIDQFGIGNGISMILFAGIISRVPSAVSSMITGVRIWSGVRSGTLTVDYVESAFNYTTEQAEAYLNQALAPWVIPLILIGVLALVVLIVFVSDAERRIPVQYAKRQVGRKMYGGQSSHLPMKVNMSGVLPVIFAQSIATLPVTIWTFIGIPEEGTVAYSIYSAIDTQSILYMVVYFLMIIGFSYFYATIQFNPVEISNNLKKNGGFIPGFRPGLPTSQFISKVLSKITLFGAIYLGIVAIVPLIAGKLLPISSLAIGGTSVIIVVGVALETVQALESQMLMRQYKGFLE